MSHRNPENVNNCQSLLEDSQWRRSSNILQQALPLMVSSDTEGTIADELLECQVSKLISPFIPRCSNRTKCHESTDINAEHSDHCVLIFVAVTGRFF